MYLFIFSTCYVFSTRVVAITTTMVFISNSSVVRKKNLILHINYVKLLLYFYSHQQEAQWMAMDSLLQRWPVWLVQCQDHHFLLGVKQ